MFPELPDILPPVSVPIPADKTKLPSPWGENPGESVGHGSGFSDNFSDKLPDSAEYLAGLERKLSKLSTQKQGPKGFLSDLSVRREDEMRRFLADKNEVVDSLNVDQDESDAVEAGNNKVISGIIDFFF